MLSAAMLDPIRTLDLESAACRLWPVGRPGAPPRHYFSQRARPFFRLEAEMDSPPFAPARFDVVIFNGSVHYSADCRRTLQEALPCEGHLG
jgi:hypothetical protein